MSFVASVNSRFVGFDPKALTQRMTKLALVILASELRLPEVLRISIKECASSEATIAAGAVCAAGPPMAFSMAFEAN